MPSRAVADISTTHKACGVSHVSFVKTCDERPSQRNLISKVGFEDIAGQAIVLNLLPLGVAVAQQLHRRATVEIGQNVGVN
jgi:hypothetical protein